MRYQSVIARTAALVLAVMFSYTAWAADESDRAGKMDISVQFNDISSEDINGERGSNATIDSDVGFGFNFAYNVDNHWNFGVEFSWRDADYSSLVVPDVGNPGAPFQRDGTIDISTTALTATYHFSPSRFTPLITANVGRTWIDTNIPNGPPVNVCWWDPYWGQYCGPTVPTKSDVYWSYGAGLGLRWESKGAFFMRALVSEQWIDVGDDVGSPSFTIFRIDLGAML